LDQRERKSPRENFFQRIKRIKNKILDILVKIREGKEKLRDIVEYMKNEKNQATFRCVKEQIIALLKHLKPVKMKGKIVYGMEDPALTGQILAGISVVYPFFHELEIVPDFEKARLEGNLDARGRIRIFNLLFIVYKLYKDDNIKLWLGNFGKQRK
jgi:hypothetical protein